MKRRERRRRIISLVLAGGMMLTMGFFSSFMAPIVSADEIGDSSQGYAKSSIDDGIDPAFREQKIGSLYNAQKLTIEMPEGNDGSDAVSIAEDANVNGTIISGSAEAVAAATFVFRDEFDFGDGIVERILTDGVSVRGSKADLAFYLDDSADAFAVAALTRQTKKDVWPEKNIVTRVYDQKITGKHRISFKLIQKDRKASVEVKLDTVIFEKSTVPTMYFNIDESLGTIEAMNNDKQHEQECYGTVSLQIPDDYEYEYSSSEEMAETENIPFEYIRGRGNSTWGNSKKPYKIKFEHSIDLFHMGANKHWVLIADYLDPSHIRNKITYWIGSQLGFAFTPQAVYVDVVMNGEYYGTYLLAEQVRLDKNRIEIDSLEKDADSIDLSAEEGQRMLTGGYILGFEGYGNKPSFKLDQTTYVIESPSKESISSEDLFAACKEYITETVRSMLEKIDSQDFEEISRYIDIDTAVDYYWVQELSRNGDAYITTSTYLYKERDQVDGTTGKFYWGPLWDFDYVAWGNNDYEVIDQDPEGFSYRGYQGYYQQRSPWFSKLLGNEEFSQKLVERWNAKISGIVREAVKENGQIDQYADQIRYSMYYNNLVYGNNYNEMLADYAFNDSVNQLKAWISGRLNWIDENTEAVALDKYTVTFVNDRKVIDTAVVYENEDITFPDVQVPEGMIVEGWYGPSQSGELVKYEPGFYQLDRDVTLEVRFIKISDLPAVKQIILGQDYIVGHYIENSEKDYDNVKYLDFGVIGGTGRTTPLNWTSSDESVVTVNKEGVLRFHGVGEAEIMVASLDGSVTASCSVKIMGENEEADSPYSAVIDPASVTITSDESAVFSVLPDPVDAAGYTVEWFTANDGIFIESIGKKAKVQGNIPGTYTVVAVISLSEYNKIYRTAAVTIEEPPAKQEFEDVDQEAYYADAVSWAVENGITMGTSETTFSPDLNCTRGQVVTFLWRAAGQPEPKTTENPFTDVKADDYYSKAVLWAVEKGITNGMTETEFEPDRACTRAQVVTFQHRAAGSPEPVSHRTAFADVPLEAWFGRAVLWAVENNITTGVSETEFLPDMNCTRGQIVTFLYRQYG